jgi:o-succinylbenzoate synthase
MRVQQVLVEAVDIPFSMPVVSGVERWERHHAGIITLRTTDGQEGRGELPEPVAGILGPELARRVTGALEDLDLTDPAAIEHVLRELEAWPTVGDRARSAVDSAVVELLACVAGLSVACFLSPGPTPTVAVNALLPMGTPGASAAAASGLAEKGYRCLKLKAGAEPAGVLEARVAAVREAVGSQVALRLDFNGSLTSKTAGDVLEAVARFDLEYAEQPIAAAEGAEALARLRWTGSVPIAADESVHDLAAARVLLDCGAVDALVVKPARVGGLRQAAAIIELATAAGVPVTVSTLFETGVGLAGALQLAATAPGPQAHGLATAGLLESDLLLAPLVIDGGRMTLPAGSGLGVELDRVAIERYRLT